MIIPYRYENTNRAIELLCDGYTVENAAHEMGITVHNFRSKIDKIRYKARLPYKLSDFKHNKLKIMHNLATMYDVETRIDSMRSAAVSQMHDLL